MDCSGDDIWDFSNYSTVPSWLLYSYTDAVIISIVNPCILTLGLLGNLAFLFVMVKIRRMWTVTNMYLINVAVADTAFLTVAVSMKLANYIASPVNSDRSTLGHAGCIITIALLDISYFASVFLVTLVSLEKFYAICRPVQHRKIGGKKRTAKLVVGAWLLALAFALVLLPAWVVYRKICIVWPQKEEYQNFPESIEVNQSITEWYTYFHDIFQTVPFFVAFIINLGLYVKIIHRLSRRVGTVSTEANAQNARRQKVRNQVAFMLVINGVAFFVCLAPFEVVSFTLTFAGTGTLTHDQINTAFWVGRIFAYINSVINPLIYNLTNPRYRQAFYEAFTCNGIRPHQETSNVVNDNTVSTLNM